MSRYDLLMSCSAIGRGMSEYRWKNGAASARILIPREVRVRESLFCYKCVRSLTLVSLVFHMAVLTGSSNSFNADRQPCRLWIDCLGTTP